MYRPCIPLMTCHFRIYPIRCSECVASMCTYSFNASLFLCLSSFYERDSVFFWLFLQVLPYCTRKMKRCRSFLNGLSLEVTAAHRTQLRSSASSRRTLPNFALGELSRSTSPRYSRFWPGVPGILRLTSGSSFLPSCQPRPLWRYAQEAVALNLFPESNILNWCRMLPFFFTWQSIFKPANIAAVDSGPILGTGV